MTRYVVTCIHTGIVMGDKEAETPAEACRLLDSDGGIEAASYDGHPPDSRAARDARTGYLVYVAPDGYGRNVRDDAMAKRLLASGPAAYVKADYVG